MNDNDQPAPARRKRKTNPRREVISLRATTDEALAFQLAASTAGKTIGEWIRDTCRAKLFATKET